MALIDQTDIYTYLKTLCVDSGFFRVPINATYKPNDLANVLIHASTSTANSLSGNPLLNHVERIRLSADSLSRRRGATHIHLCQSELPFPYLSITCFNGFLINIFTLARRSFTVKSSLTRIDTNIDEFYEKKIKVLYGDIINYATISQENMSVEDKHKIYSLKIACRDIVETIKDVKELQKNINKFINSNNKYIQAEYNYLREGIAKTLNEIHTLRNSVDDLEVLVKIKLLEESLNELDMIGNGRIDKLIRTNQIETKMATSIINDSAFAYDISKKLIQVATILWIEDKQIQELGDG